MALVISAYREGAPIAQMALPSDHRAALALLSSALLGTAADVVALLSHHEIRYRGAVQQGLSKLKK